MDLGQRIRKLYWFSTITGLAVFFLIILRQLHKSFQSKSLTFTVDSNYLDWVSSFPAVTVCEIFNNEKMWDLNEKIYGSDRYANQDDYITDIAFFSGQCHTCKSCSYLAKEDNYCLKSDVDDILSNFRTECEQLLLECQWNDEEFECCEGFIMLPTEHGACYSINSALTSPKFGKKLTSDRQSGPGTLKMVVLEDIKLFLHSVNDLPFKNSDRNLHGTILWGVTKEIIFNVQEIINDENVEKIPFQQRKCKFSWENNPDRKVDLFEYYSYSVCSVECYFQAQLDLCGCVHHLMPENKNNRTEICDLNGLICLTDNYAKIQDMRSECDCLASCTEPEINIIYNSDDIDTSGEEFGSHLTVSMVALPTVRYIRKAVRTPKDFVISLGGVCGFVFGASILTILEYLISFIKRIVVYSFRKPKKQLQFLE